MQMEVEEGDIDTYLNSNNGGNNSKKKCKNFH